MRHHRVATIAAAVLCRAVAIVLAALLVFTGRAAAAGEHDREEARAAEQILLLLHLPPDHFRADGNYAGSYGDSFGRTARRRIATQLAREHGLELLGDWPMPLLGIDCYVLAVPARQAPEPLVRALSLDRRVAWAQTMNSYGARAAAAVVADDDPLYALQPAALAWRLSELHEQATGRDVRVAVIDSGIESNHPDLDGQVWLKRNFVVDGRADAAEEHGTGVAGIIGARAGNGAGIVGVAPRSRLLALRACWQTSATLSASATRCDSLSLAKALHHAIDKRAAVINLSLSGPPDRLLGQLLDLALERGISIVAAADPGLPDGGFPAAHRGVIAVAATAAAPGAGTPLHAPGSDVPTARPGARWHLVSGASYAAAHVAGLLALLHELGGSAAAVVARPDGSIDACASLAHADAGRCPCSCAAPPLARR